MHILPKTITCFPSNLRSAHINIDILKPVRAHLHPGDSLGTISYVTILLILCPPLHSILLFGRLLQPLVLRRTVQQRTLLIGLFLDDMSAWKSCLLRYTSHSNGITFRSLVCYLTAAWLLSS